MRLTQDDLTIRNATAADAAQLCAWWSDGKVMAHAGFPNGIKCTPEEIAKSLATDRDDTYRRHVIELDGELIGEMNYRNADGSAELGIKICDFSAQKKGYGTRLLSIFIDAIFRHMSYERAILDTNLKNKRAQHVYEHKLGFRFVELQKDAWHDQLGELNSTMCYDMSKADWLELHKEPLGYNFSLE